MDDNYDEAMDGQRPINPLYERHDGLGINQNQRVAVIGCGGIGSWIALYLGLAGVKEIDIYDSDIISENNLNRFPLGPDKIGVNKAIAISEHIQYLRNDVNVTPRQNFDAELHRDKLWLYNWVIVTTDSLKSRRMIYDEVVKAGKSNECFIGYIEAGADGHHATVTFSPADFQTDMETNPGYQIVPVFVGPCTLAASIVAYYVLLNDPKDYKKTFMANWVINSEFHIATIDEADEIIIEETNLLDIPLPYEPNEEANDIIIEEESDLGEASDEQTI